MKRFGKNTPPTKRQLQNVAELRAEGYSWPQIAKELNAKAVTISRWPWRYPDLWKKLYQQAEDLVSHHVAAESRHILIQQFRKNEDAKSQIDAAGKLLTYTQRRNAKTATRTNSLSPAALRMAEYLQGLTDEDLHTLAHTLDTPAEIHIGPVRANDPPSPE